MRLDITDTDGSAQDVTSWAFAGQIRRTPSDPVVADLSFDATTNGAEGTVWVTLAGGDTQVGRFHYAIEYDDGSGLGFVPLLHGTWTMREQWRY